MFYKRGVRPLLFQLEAERAHNVVSYFLKKSAPLVSSAFLRKVFSYHSIRLESRLSSLSFPNPVGIAAGFDKEGSLYSSLCALGFGFVECGTFTRYKQSGNPRPRLFRLPKEEALINAMGFNNRGALDAAALLYKQEEQKKRFAQPRGISIGKSRVIDNLEEVIEDYLYSFAQLRPFADYIAINVSSPNTPDLGKLQKQDALDALLEALQNKQKQEDKPLPIFVKVAPDLSLAHLDQVLETLLQREVTGIILSNTSLSLKAELKQKEARNLEGGLSGKPLFEHTLSFIRHAFRQAGRQLKIIGVGGISSPQEALKAILAGASLIQIYTGYIYEGPLLPLRINRFLDNYLEKEKSVLQDIVGQE